MAWRQPGNDYFKQRLYNKAILAYSIALETNEDDHLLLSNRAEAFLKLKQYTEAYHDALDVTQRCDTDVKGHYRLGRALSGLDRYEEARVSLETAHRLDRSNHAVFKELESVRALLQSKRKTRWTGLLRQALGEMKKCGSFRSSLEDYIGDVEIQHTWTGKGRGLYATHDIPAGAVILACKSVAMVSSEEGSTGAPSSDNPAKRLAEGLIGILADKLSDPDNGAQLESQLSSLCIGSGPSTPRPKPTGDSEEDRRATRAWVSPMIRYNAYASSSWDPASALQSSRNMANSELPHTATTSKADATNFVFDYGLWNLPSYINHSCLFNSFHFMLGDVFVLVSNRDIPATDEITTFYIRPDEPRRRAVLKNDYGFLCKCAMCTAENGLPAECAAYTREARRQLDDVSEQIVKLDDDCMEELKTALTYARQADDRKLLRPNRTLTSILTSMVLMWSHHKNWSCATEALNGAYESLMGKPKKAKDQRDDDDLDVPFGGGSASPEPLVVELAIQLSCVLSRERRFKEAQKWLERARQLSVLLYAVDDVANMYFGNHFALAEQGLAEGRQKEKK